MINISEEITEESKEVSLKIVEQVDLGLDLDKLKRNVDNIPLELRELETWCGYYINEEEKIVKKPISIVDGYGVGTKDKDRLVSFEVAKDALKSGKVAAIGVGLTADCDITCIDIDCHEDSKKIKFEELNKMLLNQFDSYSEVSVSGQGTHIFIRGKKPCGYKHSDKYGIIEVYDIERFMIVTGDIIGERATEVKEYQGELEKLCEHHLVVKEVNQGFVNQNEYEVSTEQVIEKIKEFKKGNLFLQGKWEEVQKWDKAEEKYIQAYHSQSEADFAFIMQILYVNGNNPDHAEKIFMGSKMYRKDKKSSGYLKHQVAEASLRLTKVYDWKKVTTDKLEEEVDMEAVILDNKVNELIENIRNRGFLACNNQNLNKFMTKYILNFAIGYRDIVDTSLGDYDSAANGLRFYYVNKGDLMYIDQSKEWLKWTGKVWRRCYDIDLLDYTEKVFNNIKHEAYNIAISSLSELDEYIKEDLEKEAEELFKYASTAKSKKNCLEMIEFSKSHFIKNSEVKFNENINALNLQNGLYDFDKKELLEHSKEYFQTKISEAVYVEEEKCETWEKTLERLVPNEDIRKYLQKAVGYTVSAKNKEKVLFILHGEGNNGKTTFINILLKIMGDYGVVVAPTSIMENYSNKNNGPRPDLLRLRDKRFAAVSESEENDKLGEGLIKSLTGGGYISCRGLHKEPVEFPANFKLWFDTNHKPTVRGTDVAIWNRLKVIPFTIQIPKSEIDTELGSKLEKELSGILNWCIEGYEMFKEEGLEEPEEMRLIMSEYSEDMSAMDQWWKECVDILRPEKAKKNHRCYTSKELYQSYKHWADYNGEYSWTQRKFTQEINKKEACKFVKKVNGITKYLAIELNELGQHCADKDSLYIVQFTKEYNSLVNKRFTELARAEKEIADYEKSLGKIKKSGEGLNPKLAKSSDHVQIEKLVENKQVVQKGKGQAEKKKGTEDKIVYFDIKE